MSSLLKPAWSDDVIPPTDAAANIPVWRFNRLGLDLYRSFGSSTTVEKAQGYGFGFVGLFPLKDSGFDLGFRYSRISQDEKPFTILTFVFDYFIFPAYVRGVYLGGEVGVTNSDAEGFFSIKNDYVFAGKIGYEYWIPETRFSAALELRRLMHTPDPIQQTSESRPYTNGLMFSARYTY